MPINIDNVNPGPGRPRGRPALALDRIVGAALELVDEEGAAALSMRSLAQRLGSGTATLYRHFADRAELVAMVVDRLLGEVAVEDAAGLPWDQACAAFGHGMFEALVRHGNVAPLLIGHVPLGPNAMAHREHMISVLLADGFPAQTAAHIYATLSRYTLGFAMQASASGSAGQHDAAVSDAFRRLDPGRYPATTAVAEHLPVPLVDEFSFGLQLITAGLRRQHS